MATSAAPGRQIESNESDLESGAVRSEPVQKYIKICAHAEVSDIIARLILILFAFALLAAPATAQQTTAIDGDTIKLDSTP